MTNTRSASASSKRSCAPGGAWLCIVSRPPGVRPGFPAHAAFGETRTTEKTKKTIAATTNSSTQLW